MSSPSKPFSLSLSLSLSTQLYTVHSKEWILVGYHNGSNPPMYIMWVVLRDVSMECSNRTLPLCAQFLLVVVAVVVGERDGPTEEVRPITKPLTIRREWQHKKTKSVQTRGETHTHTRKEPMFWTILVVCIGCSVFVSRIAVCIFLVVWVMFSLVVLHWV